jgi:hypothetical protein
LVLQDLDDAKGFANTSDVGKGLASDEECGGEGVELLVSDEDLEPGATVMVTGGKYAGRAGVVVSLGTTTCRLRFADSGTVTGNLKRSSVVVVDSEGGPGTAAAQLFQARPSKGDAEALNMDDSLETEVTRDNEEQLSSRRTMQFDSALDQAGKVATSLQGRGLPYNPKLELLRKQQELLREQYVQNRELFDTLDDDDDDDDDGDEKDANEIDNANKNYNVEETEQVTVIDANTDTHVLAETQGREDQLCEGVGGTCLGVDNNALIGATIVGQATLDMLPEGEQTVDIDGFANEKNVGTTAGDENSRLSTGNNAAPNADGAATASQLRFASTVKLLDETNIAAADSPPVQAPAEAISPLNAVGESGSMTLREESLQEESLHEQIGADRGASDASLRSATDATAVLFVPRNHGSQKHGIAPADERGDEDMAVLLAPPPLPNDDSLSIGPVENIAAQLQRAHAVLESEDWDILGSNDGDFDVSGRSLLNYDDGATTSIATMTITGTTAQTNKTLNILTNIPTNEKSGGALEVERESVDWMTSPSRESGGAYALNLSVGPLSITGDGDELLANRALNDDSLNSCSAAQYDEVSPAVHGTIHASVAEPGKFSLSLDTFDRGALSALRTSETAPQDESLAAQISLSLDASALGGRGSDVMEFDMGQKVDESVRKKREMFEQRSRARAGRVKKAASIPLSACGEQDSASAEVQPKGSLPSSASSPQPAPWSGASQGSGVASAAQRLAVEAGGSGAGKAARLGEGGQSSVRTALFQSSRSSGGAH